MKKELLILVISKDNKTWTRFSDWSVPFGECCSKNKPWMDGLVDVCKTIPDLNNTYIELVSDKFFNKFHHPFDYSP